MDVGRGYSAEDLYQLLAQTEKQGERWSGAKEKKAHLDPI